MPYNPRSVLATTLRLHRCPAPNQFSQNTAACISPVLLTPRKQRHIKHDCPHDTTSGLLSQLKHHNAITHHIWSVGSRQSPKLQITALCSIIFNTFVFCIFLCFFGFISLLPSFTVFWFSFSNHCAHPPPPPTLHLPCHPDCCNSLDTKSMQQTVWKRSR